MSPKEIALTLAVLTSTAIFFFSNFFSKVFPRESRKNPLEETQESIRTIMEHLGWERDKADLFAIAGVFLLIVVMFISYVTIICLGCRGGDEDDQNAPAPQAQNGQQRPRNQHNDQKKRKNN